MTRFLLVALAACLASPLWAQTEAEGETPNASDAAASDVLSTGTPVDGIGTTYVAETHGDWEIRCIRVEEGLTEPCQLYQLLLDEGGSAVAEFNIFDLPGGEQVVAGATIVTPLDTLLTPQLRMRVDDGQTLAYPFSFCQDIGCFVRIGLTEPDLAVFRAGGEATITIVPLPAPDQTVDLLVSLSGITAGLEALVARSPVLPPAEE